LLIAALVAATLVACGGPAEGPKSPDSTAGSAAGSAAPRPSGGGDDVVDVPPIKIKGVYLQPEAMDGLGVPAVPMCKRCTLESEKKKLETAKTTVEKQAHAVILASELFRQSQKNADAAAKKQQLSDARQLLRDAVAGVTGKDKPDETVLLLLGRYELLLDDPASGEKVWTQLLTVLDPKDKHDVAETPNDKAWLALSLLKEGKNADALTVIKDEPADKSAVVAYVTAWAKWRTGDNAGAWKAITSAAQLWDGPPGKGEGLPDREALKRDLILFAARTGTSMSDALAVLGPFFGKQPADQYQLVRQLGEAYHFAARWQDALAADAKALDMKAPPNDRVSILFEEAQLSLPLDAPADVDKYAKAAVEALPACGSACSAQDAQNVLAATLNIAARFHSVYATANDMRYHDAAKDLYAEIVTKIVNPNMRATAVDYQNKLDLTFAHMKVGTGRHDKNDTAAMVDYHAQEIQACYESALNMNSKLVGDLTLTIELAQDGSVTGVSTEPKAGTADVPAVATCVSARAKAWKLPARGSKGTTRVKMTYNLELRK
jgi:hypothetical protein